MTRIVALLLLLFNGIGACFGGLGMIMDPSGESLQLSTEMLRYSPFTNFLIPGWILFVVLGLGSIVACVVVLLKSKGYPFLTIFMGFALSIWIGVQVLMLHEVNWLHILFGFIGIALIVLGIFLRKKSFRSLTKL